MKQREIRVKKEKQETLEEEKNQGTGTPKDMPPSPCLAPSAYHIHWLSCLCCPARALSQNRSRRRTMSCYCCLSRWMNRSSWTQSARRGEKMSGCVKGVHMLCVCLEKNGEEKGEGWSGKEGGRGKEGRNR